MRAASEVGFYLLALARRLNRRLVEGGGEMEGAEAGKCAALTEALLQEALEALTQARGESHAACTWIRTKQQEGVPFSDAAIASSER